MSGPAACRGLALALLLLAAPLGAQAGSLSSTTPAAGSVTNAMLANPCITLQDVCVNLGGTALATTSAPTFGGLTLSGTFTGQPTWASSQTFPGATINGTLAMGANAVQFTDTALLRDAANALAVRNGTNAQKFLIYRTYTDVNNFARFGLFWSGNDAYFGQDSSDLLGTGVAGDLYFSVTTGKTVYLRVGGSRIMFTDTAGGLLTVPTPTLLAGTNGAGMTWGDATTTVNAANLAATITATNLIPAGAVVYLVVTRNTAVFNGTLTSFTIGDGTTANLFGNNVSLALNATTDLTNHLATFKPTLYTAAASVVMTAVGGTFGTTGTIRITVFYYTSQAPTS